MTRTIDLKKRRRPQRTSALLEEVAVPLEEPSSMPPPITEMVEAPSGDRFLVKERIRVSSGSALYHGLHKASGRPVWVFAATDARAASLRRTYEALAGINFPMFYEPMALVEVEGVTYLVTEPHDGEPLIDVLPRLSTREVVSILAQVAAGLKVLHARNWIHGGIQPRTILVGKPLKITGFDYVTPMGTPATQPIAIPGFSAPEARSGAPLSAHADIYGLGAILYEAITGSKIPDTGFETTGWSLSRPIAGVPQILRRCLMANIADSYPTMENLHRALVRLATRMQPALHYTLAGNSSIGLEPTRETNQDGYSFLQSGMVSEGRTMEWAVACVSDGMGGMEGGDIASEAAVAAVLGTAGTYDPRHLSMSSESHAKATHSLAIAANSAACEALTQRKLKGGATLVCAYLVGRQLALAHIGDSRIYLFREGTIVALTRDHSVAMARVLQGEMSVNEIRSDPNRSIVTRSIGDRKPMPEYYVDSLRQTTDADTLQMQVGDTLLLCSDGVWEPVMEDEMLQIVAQQNCSLQATADKIVALALERGGSDNATALLVRASEAENL